MHLGVHNVIAACHATSYGIIVRWRPFRGSKAFILGNEA